LKSPIILRIFKDNQLVEVKQFESDQIIFGHDADVTVDLSDESISAIHCLIELRDSGYYLCDMGSGTGTRKNGNPILDEPLSSGDNIEVGPFRIQFFVGAPKPKVAPAAAVIAEAAPQTTKVAETPQEETKAAPVVPPRPPAEPPPAPKAQMPPAPKEQAPPAQKTQHVPPPQVPKAPPSAVKTNIPPKAPVAQAVKPPKLPDAHMASAAMMNSKKHTKTFAPPSEIKDLGDYLKPTKGPVVEVIVAWQERILATYHFGADQNVTIGSAKTATISIPSNFIQGAVPFLDLKGGCRVLAPADMTVEVTNGTPQRFGLEDMMKSGKSAKTGTANSVRLDQGELLRLTGPNGTVQIFVRYVQNTVKPALAAPLDFSAGEMTGLVVSLVIVALTALYMSVYTPPVAEEKPEEQVRLATFIYNSTTTTTMAHREPTPPPVKEVVEVKPPPPPPEPKKIKVTDEKKDAVTKGNKDLKPQPKQVEAARASELRPTDSKTRPKFGSVKHGGAVKTGAADGANAQSNKDVNRVGLLSAFGGGGVRKQLDKAYQGSGELLGMADKANGSSGFKEDRAGDDLGSKIKEGGGSGKGTATVGIAGVGTKGRGSGMSTYGNGIGLGGKGNVTIDAGGAEEGWEGTIDREAVRRVIRSILNQIKSCYERRLRENSSLEGKVVIQFEIMEQGRVRTAKTKTSSLGDSTVESCVAARIKDARFPEPPSGTIAVVDYPFVFGAQK
jgi:TonB family protein